MTTTPATSADSNAIIANYQARVAAAKAAANPKTTTTDSTSIESVTANYDTFIKILTTQLQNQDPTNASDTDKFTAELVQFSGIEQQLATNKKLDTLIAQGNTSGVRNAIGYVGKYVEAPMADDQITVQGGASEFAYNLTDSASNVLITIKDANGKTVATMNGANSVGLHRVKWDGTENDGSAAADGVYTMTLKATKTDGSTLTVADTRVIGKVTGAESQSDGTTLLSLGSVQIKESDIDAVFDNLGSSS